MDYRIETPAEYRPVMDLFAAEKLRGRPLIKMSALVCFIVAGALLVASLFVPPPAQVGSDQGKSSGFTSSIR
jgi:hypothetical protein